ncbi:MAG: ATP synthase F1 subunit delta [Alphaproteobacteria bacterium]|nr:ATP synthase F1 subunit delta [Alphaproteobacteria bacterium]
MQKVSKHKIVSSYAKAWLDAGISAKKEDEILKEVEALEISFTENKELWSQLQILNKDSVKAVELIKYLAEKLKFTPITANTLILIAENKRLDFLPQILKEWQKLYNEDNSIVEVEVESVVSLKATEIKKITQVLEKKINKNVKITNKLNKDILGGLRIRFSGYQIDDSLFRKLDDVCKLTKG